MPRRALSRVLVVVVLGISLMAPPAGVANQATPESGADNPFADLGLPLLDITMSDDSFEGFPSDLDAGRYVVALTNTSDADFADGGAFLQVPPEMTTDEFLQMAAPLEATPDAGVMANAEASPMPEGNDLGYPQWYYETAIAGGPYAAPGETSWAVIDLAAGEWVFWAEYPGAPQAPVPITVSGEMPADVPTPQADVTVEMSDFAFTFTGELTPGTHIVELANVGDQPHFMAVAGLPEGTTLDDVMGLLELELAMIMGTPMATPANGLSFDDVEEVFTTGDQSAGVTSWYVLTLDTGTYGAVCFVTDPETGMPHAMLGMVDVFDVDSE